jgi:transketolase
MTDTRTQPDEAGMVDVFSDQQPPDGASNNPIGWELARLADLDPRVVALSADMSAVLAELRGRHPGRYFELGIAETNTVSVAAGLATCGLLPYVVSMGPFGVIKCAEQLRTDVAYTNLPVRLVARLSGLAMGFFGPSHQAVEDIAMARAITNLTVVAPADFNAALGVLRSTFDHDGPVYVRYSEGTLPVYDAPRQFTRGEWVPVRAGADLTIIGTGAGVGLGLRAAEALESDGVAAAVLDAVYLKPFDEAAIVAAAAAGPVLTVEEHSVVGGLGALVCEVLGRHGLRTPVDVVALPDTEMAVGVPAKLYEHYGLTPDAVAARARRLLGR